MSGTDGSGLENSTFEGPGSKIGGSPDFWADNSDAQDGDSAYWTNSGDGFVDGGDPIDLGLADKSHVQIDYLSQAAAPIRMSRVYHSNSSANTARVLVPMGTGWHMFYDRSSQLISANQIRLHRANGRTLDFNWNGSAWVSTLPAGVLTHLSGGGWQYVNHRNKVETYNSNGRLLSMSDGGLVTTIQYDANSRLTGVTNPFGRSLIYSYDSSGRVANVTLPSGKQLVYGYDAQNNLVSTKFTDNSVRQYVYENTSFPNALTGIVDETGRRRLTWSYDGAGRPTGSRCGTRTATTTAVYSTDGSTVTTTDARGTQRTRMFATVAGRRVLSSIQTAATAQTAASGLSFSYDTNGNLTSTTTRTGEVKSFTPDSRGRQTSATRGTGTAQALSKQTIWDPVYRTPQQVTAFGVTTNYVLDAYGRVTGVTRTSSATPAMQNMQSLTYNAQNLVQTLTDARGATSTFAYDGAGNRTSTTDSMGHVTTFGGYNANGQATRITRSDGSVVSRSYDSRGRLATRTDSGVTTTFTYDNANRIAKVLYADGSWQRYTYDSSAGLLQSIANNRGETTTIARDSTGTETGRSEPPRILRRLLRLRMEPS